MIKKALLEKSVEEYNKYHGAEARVKILGQVMKTKGHLLVQLEGPFCFSCSLDEYYVDFQLLLEEITGLKFEVSSVKQGNGGIIVDFEYEKGKPALTYILHF